MSLQIAEIFPEDIERCFRNSLPKEAVDTLIRLAINVQECEKAIQDLHNMNKELVKIVTMSGKLHASLNDRLKKFESRFDGSSLLTTEAVGGEQ